MSNEVILVSVDDTTQDGEIEEHGSKITLLVEQIVPHPARLKWCGEEAIMCPSTQPLPLSVSSWVEPADQ